MELLARKLNPKKYELHLGLVTQTETDAKLSLACVCVHCLGAARVRGGALSLLKLVRQIKPDLILSGMFHLNFLVLLLRPLFPRKTRILVRQNGTISSALVFAKHPLRTHLLYKLLYRNANKVICQTRSMAEDLSVELGLSETRITVLPNPVDVEMIRNFTVANLELKADSGPQLLAVGRLSREKGFDLLLRALASLHGLYPETRLLIAGEGPEEVTLKAECRALGLDSSVNFAGQIAQPWTLFPDAALFVLSSRHEGMPNALLEAAAGGLPIVALPSSGGVVDLLRGQPGVWLAPEVSAEALAAALLAALQSLRPGERFSHSFVDDFGIGRAIEAYEQLIDGTLEDKRR
jgi:glycosyltransferase involved in cell wall biosynthesis